MDQQISKTKNIKIKLILCVVVIYVFYIFITINQLPLVNPSEEVGALSGASYLAGLDWSGVMSNSSYYGIGWYSLFFWIFKLTDSPYIIYHVIVSITALINPLIFLISHYILKRYLSVNSENYAIILSVLATVLSGSIASCANEAPLRLCIWLIILCSCKALEYGFKKRGMLFLFLIMAICIYSLSIHTRALTLLIAIILVFIFLAIIKKSIRPLIPAITLPVLYFIADSFITEYKQILWGVSSAGDLVNSTVTINLDINLFDIKTWAVWFHMLVGMIGTENILTGGIFILSIIGLIFFIISFIKNKKWDLNVYAGVILSITILCIGATIVAFLLSSWFKGIYSTWGQSGTESIYAYKGMTYVRYWDVYLSPFIICVLAYLPKFNWKKIINTAFLFSIVTYVLFIIFVLPYIQNNGDAASVFYGIGNHSYGDSLSAEFYLYCISLSLIVSALAILLVNINNHNFRELAALPIIILLAGGSLNFQTNFYSSARENRASKVLSSYEAKSKLEEFNINIGTIYLNDETGNTDGNLNIYSIAQFYFNHYALNMNLPQIIEDNDIIISTNKSRIIESNYLDINCYVLDDNEVWYTYMDIEEYLF